MKGFRVADYISSSSPKLGLRNGCDLPQLAFCIRLLAWGRPPRESYLLFTAEAMLTSVCMRNYQLASVCPTDRTKNDGQFNDPHARTESWRTRGSQPP